MKILLTGATGFVGGYILNELEKMKIDVRCLVRPLSQWSKGVTPKKENQYKIEREKIITKGFEICEGNISDFSSLKSALEGVDVVINLVGIIIERGENTFERVHYQWVLNLIKASAESNIKKIIHMSALGSRSDAASKYHRTKWLGEDLVRKSGITHTIFKPSVIVGRGDGFSNTLIDLIKKPLITPVIGPGKNKIQPIFAGDIARCYAQAVTDPNTDNKTFELGGKESYTLNEMLNLIEKKLSQRDGKWIYRYKFRIHIPAAFMTIAAFLLERIFASPPITVDQIKMIREDNICDYSKLKEVFAWDFTPFETALEETIAGREKGIGNLSKGEIGITP
ncbi:MAG: complex I NDUFA9 subunit family protein [Nitrospinota bacterium]